MSPENLSTALRDRLRSLIASDLVRRTTVLSGGVAIGQLALLLSTPLLTRLCSPEAFGLFGVLYTIVTMFGVMGLLQLEVDLPLCSEDEVPTALLAQLAIGLVTTVLLGLALFFWRTHGGTSLVLPDWADWLVPLGGFLQLAILPLSYLHVRHRAYLTYAKQRMNRLLAQAAGQVAFAGLGLGALGLWLGLLSGQLVALVTGWRSVVPELRRIRPRHLRTLPAYLRRARYYPLWVLPSALLGTATQHLPPLLAALTFSTTEAGLLLLVQRVFLLPIRLLSHAVSQALLGELREMSPSVLYRTTLRCLAVFAALGSGLVLIALLPGVRGWSLLLGSGWEPFWELLVHLAPAYLAAFVSEAVRTVFVFEAKRLLFLQSVLGLILTLSCFGLPLVTAVEFSSVVLSYSVTSAVSQSVFLGLLLVKLARGATDETAPAARPVLAARHDTGRGTPAPVDRSIGP